MAPCEFLRVSERAVLLSSVGFFVRGDSEIQGYDCPIIALRTASRSILPSSRECLQHGDVENILSQGTRCVE